MNPYYKFVLIDDDPDESELFQAALDDLPFTPYYLSFLSWDDAYAYFAKNRLYKPDFIVLDAVLNGILFDSYISSLRRLDNLADSSILVYSPVPKTSFFEETLAEMGCGFLLKSSTTAELRSDLLDMTQFSP